MKVNMSEKLKPYIVSADTYGLFKTWANKNGLLVPQSSYFEGMLKELEQVLGKYFDQVDVISESELIEGLNRMVATSALPVVSLDRAYVRPGQDNLLGYLDVTRTVDQNLNNVGLGSRRQDQSIIEQVKSYAYQLNGRPIALIDDVVFDGNTMLQVAQTFEAAGVPVEKVFTGIVVEDGKKLLEQNGLEVESVVDPYGEVTDEICERDFRVGVPYSGRTVETKGGLKGAPYILPFGKPVEWASIPADSALEFSLFALSQFLQLWSKTEQLSRQNISTWQVAKPTLGLPENKSVSRSIAEVMRGLK